MFRCQYADSLNCNRFQEERAKLTLAKPPEAPKLRLLERGT